MIQIQIDRADKAAAEFSEYSNAAARICQQIHSLTEEISRQSYTEETVRRLKAVQTCMEEIQNACGAMGNGLRELLSFTVGAERRIAQVYSQERTIPRIPQTGVSTVMLYENLADIAKIEL